MSALGDRLSTPPAPEMPGARDNQTSSGALAGGRPPMQPQQQAPAPAPAPNHTETVAALRHFAAIGKQLDLALKDPNLGKADLKSKIIDGMTSLVSDRMMSSSEAISQLSTVPERPFEQKQWVQSHLQQIMAARDAVLAHHAVAYAGQGPQPTPSADNHMQDITGLMQSHYGGRRA